MKESATEQPLLLQVRMAFIGKGTSFHRWCAEAGVDRSYAAKAISGTATFPAAKVLRKRILTACGLLSSQDKARRAAKRVGA